MTDAPGKTHPPRELSESMDRALYAMRQGVREALARHKRLGQAIVVWRDGRVVRIPADEIPVELTTPLPEWK